MRRKGQSINIDWTIGLALFLFTALASILFITDSDIGPQPVNSLEAKAFDVQANLEEETSVEGGRIPLIARGPVNISDIPVDRGYSFPEGASTGSEAGEIPVEANFSGGNVVAVTDGGNLTHHLVYFNHSVNDIDYSNDIEVGSSITNSEISVTPGSPGVTSLQVNGKEVLNPDVDLGAGTYSVNEEELYAETLSGDLRVYNGSSELVLDDRTSNVTFDLKNLTTLYWYSDNSTTDLTGTGTIKQGETKGFTVASDYGITFIGDLSATVSKPDSSTVRAEIDATKLRVRLHDSDYNAGRKRIRFYDEGYILLGAEEEFSAPYSSEIERVRDMTRLELDNSLNLEDFGYNISFGSEGESHYIDRGDPIPLDVSTVVSERPSALIDRNGSFSEIRNRVVLWQ